MNAHFALSQLAKKDLEQIWIYTLQNWSRSQANKYYKDIINELNNIYQHPELGRSIDYVQKDHRIKQAQSHLIVYKVQGDKIWVVRILHQSMDVESRLEP